jgi:AraC-like DNA-binding protein
MPTISAHYFFHCVQGARRQGKDARGIYATAGVDPVLLSDLTARGDTDSMARLVRAVWYALDDEFMGFTEHRAKVGLFGLMTRFIIGNESLEQALLAGARFYNLVREDVYLGLQIVQGEAVFEAKFSRPELDPDHYFLEFWMVIWHRLASWLTGGPVPLNRVTFTFARPDNYMEEFKYLFPCKHDFSAARNTLVFDARYLRMPVIRSRDELRNLLIQAPLEWLTMPASDQGVARRVRTALLPRNGQAVEFPNLDEVAEQFNMTPQTLRRRLKDESTSYRTIKENIRRDIAIKKVLLGASAIEDIAYLVGYSETRAFTRAFHQWTGLSPMQYRQKFYRPLEA